jgi:hypothetical protein
MGFQFAEINEPALRCPENMDLLYGVAHASDLEAFVNTIEVEIAHYRIRFSHAAWLGHPSVEGCETLICPCGRILDDLQRPSARTLRWKQRLRLGQPCRQAAECANSEPTHNAAVQRRRAEIC